MEEIDIIELLKRVKEGKAPKEIEIDRTKYFYNQSDDISCIYVAPDEHYHWLVSNHIALDTKIKILDKPIIEKLNCFMDNDADNELKNKINEIIDILNKENKDE